MGQECSFRPHPETSSSKCKISLTLPRYVLFRLDLSILNNTFTAEIFEMLMSLEEILLERDRISLSTGAGASRGRRGEGSRHFQHSSKYNTHAPHLIRNGDIAPLVVSFLAHSKPWVPSSAQLKSCYGADLKPKTHSW